MQNRDANLAPFYNSLPAGGVFKGDVYTSQAPIHWSTSCTHSEHSLNQLSPYIGKLKSSIASDLIAQFSSEGDLVVDPFCGSGTVPFEAALLNRKTFSSDVNPYSILLTKAKLQAPKTEKAALALAETALEKAANLPDPDVNEVPNWVREFFHPSTLVDVIKFAEICRAPGMEFLMACLLGILHHQRPGFLSFPSSHLTPYLRTNKYPIDEFPEMYEFRELAPRLLAKVRRAYKRAVIMPQSVSNVVRKASIFNVTFPQEFNCLITSPPYMNALDYGRDNRLRLWLLSPDFKANVDSGVSRNRQDFALAMAHLAKITNRHLVSGGYCVLVVGEILNRTYNAHPANTVCEVLQKKAVSLKHVTTITDDIPDVRRSRRELKGVKTEIFLVFRKD